MVTKIMPISILLIDAHSLMRAGTCALLDNYPDLEVIGEAGSLDEAILRSKELQPDVILINLLNPEDHGIPAIRDIIDYLPQARILVMANTQDDDTIFSVIKAGALGYLLNNARVEDLVSAIHQVNRGQPALDSNIALKLINEIRHQPTRPLEEKNLTAREMDVLNLLMKGLSNQEIGKSLVITERTVSAHVNRILKKLNVANRTQAALLAYQSGYENKNHSNQNT